MVHGYPKTPLLLRDGERGFCILWPSLVVKGKSIKDLIPLCLTIEGEGTHKVEPGMGLLVPANTWHSMGNDGNEDLMYVTAHPAVDVSREMKEA